MIWPRQYDPLDLAEQRISAIILSAGYSSRMAEFKPLLPLGGAPAVERGIRLFQRVGIHDVIVVLGHHADRVRPVAEAAGARCVWNSDFAEGMYSSVVAGVRALSAQTQACFVLPVDIPLIRKQTLLELASSYVRSGSQIVYPVFEGRRGHPPLIAREILQEALQPESGPLCKLLERHAGQASDVEVVDEGIHLDMDTPADYRSLCVRAEKQGIPTIAECEAILSLRHAPSSLIFHSKAVAATSVCLAMELNQTGLNLDLDVVQTGALLHDLAKGQPHHDIAGGSYLLQLGFPQVAEVVAVHHDLDFSESKLSESAVVFLADKLIQGENLVSLEERFRPALERFKEDLAAWKAANQRFLTARLIAKAVEDRIGYSIEKLLQVKLSNVSQITVWHPGCITT